MMNFKLIIFSNGKLLAWRAQAPTFLSYPAFETPFYLCVTNFFKKFSADSENKAIRLRI